MLKRIDEKYSISDEGEVFRGSGVRVQPRIDGGLLVVSLHGNKKSVSTLLLEAFVGPKPKLKWAVCKDGNRRNMDLRNWEWDWTPSVKKRKDASARNQERIRLNKARLAEEKEKKRKARIAMKKKLDDKATAIKIKVANIKAKAAAAEIPSKNPNLPSPRPCSECGAVFRSIKNVRCPKCREVKPYVMKW